MTSDGTVPFLDPSLQLWVGVQEALRSTGRWGTLLPTWPIL